MPNDMGLRSGSVEMLSENDSHTHDSDLLSALYQMPVIDKAWLLPSQTGNKLQAMVVMHQVDLLLNIKRKYLSFMYISNEGDNKMEYTWSAFPIELTAVTLLVPSKSGKKQLVIKNTESDTKENAGSTKLEIWNSAQLLKEIIVPASVHGHVYADGWFEGVSWSEDESCIAYVAEDVAPKRPIFGKPYCSKDKSDEGNPYTWKGHGDWQEDWGEAYTGKRRPAIFVMDTEIGSVMKLDGIPDDLTVGQVVWAPRSSRKDFEQLVFVGWPSFSENFRTCRKLGIKYCSNRPCALYVIDAPHAERCHSYLPCIRKLTNSMSSAFLPRFSLDGKFLVFLSAQQAVERGTHNATNSFHRLQWPVDEEKALETNVMEVVSAIQTPGGFPGLYCQSLVTFPWLMDKHTFLLSSYWHSSQVILAINAISGQVTRISPSDDNGCWTLLCVHEKLALTARSSFGCPPRLKLGVPSDSDGLSATWNWSDVHSWSFEKGSLHAPSTTPSIPGQEVKAYHHVDTLLSSIIEDIMDIVINDKDPHGIKKSVQAIFVSSNSTETKALQKKPLVVIIHGGPHMVETNSFSPNYAYLIGLGFNVMVVNYRGSLGFGEPALQSLPGNVGIQDVADILLALDHVIVKGLVDPSKVTVLGGSHGGFLSTHLIGQAPDRFVAAAVRNPVCNIASMVGTCDIPDWCYVETFGKACFSSYSDGPSPQDMAKFFQASPIAHVNNVKAPTLFLLGGQDRRVPISNGIQFMQVLRSRGVEVKVIIFPEDDHPINKPQSEYESWLNIGAWFKRHLKVVH